MTTSTESNDSGWDASGSDFSPELDCLSISYYESLNGRTSCGSSTESNLSYRSLASFRKNKRRFPRPTVPGLSSDRVDEFQYTMVTPISYTEVKDTDSNTRGCVDYRRSKGSRFLHAENNGLGREGAVRNPGSRQKFPHDTGRSGRFARKRSAFGEDDTMNVSNNDNDCGLHGTGRCSRKPVRRRNFDAVVMPCCDDPQQNFYFEQNRFPPGCLDIVLNGNDRTTCYNSSDTSSDIYRASGCESEDQFFRSSTSGFVSADQYRSRSWGSLNSFEGSEGLDEVLTSRFVPGDCFFEDELMRDDVELLPVSVSLQSLSSSVGVHVRCAEGIVCVDTALCKSNDDDGAMVDMTISAKNCGRCSEEDEGNQYEVELTNNYIRCSDNERRNDKDNRMKQSFLAGRCYGREYTRGKAAVTTPYGKRIMKYERDDCYNSEYERKAGRRPPSKSSLTSASTQRRRRGKRSSHHPHRTHSKHRKSNRKSPKRSTDDDQRRKRHRRSGANIAHRKSSNRSRGHGSSDARSSRRGKSRTQSAARIRSRHKRSTDGSSGISQKRSIRGDCSDWSNAADRPRSHTASHHRTTSTARRKRSSHKGDSDSSRGTTVTSRYESHDDDGEERKGRATKRTKSSHHHRRVVSAQESRTGTSRTDVSTSKSAIDTRGSSADSNPKRTPYSSNSQHSVRSREETRGRSRHSVASIHGRSGHSIASIQGRSGHSVASIASTRSAAKSSHWNRSPNVSSPKREAYSLEISPGNKSQSAVTSVLKANSAPATLGNNKSGTKRAFRIETMRLKPPDNRAAYHDPEETMMGIAQADNSPEPVPDQPMAAQADSSYHETDLIVMSIDIQSKPKGYGPVSGSYLAGGEIFGKPFRYIPYIFPIRANVCYEDDHGLRRNITTSSIHRRFNRAMTQSNPAFVEQVQLLPSLRSSRVVLPPQPIDEVSSPLSLASTLYLDAVIEQGQALVRVPSAEAGYAPRNSESVIGYIESVSMPQTLSSSSEYTDRSNASPRRKQSVSFADIDTGLDSFVDSMYPPYFPEENPLRDELYLKPSAPDDAFLDPSELLARVAAASDRDLMRPSLLATPKSSSIGTSVTQVVSRWRKHYMDDDPCFPRQACKDTWVRSLNSKSIHFNDSDVVVGCPTKLRDCRSVETNKIIYFEKTGCSIEPTDSHVSCGCGCEYDDFSDSRLPYRRSSDSASTVSSACCRCRPLSNSSSTIVDSRHRRFSSISRSAMGFLSSSSSSNRFGGDGNGSSLLQSGDSYRSGNRFWTESDEREKFYVESMLATIKSSAKDIMTGMIANEAVQQQQQKQQLKQQQLYQQNQPFQQQQQQQQQQQPKQQQQQKYQQRESFQQQQPKQHQQYQQEQPFQQQQQSMQQQLYQQEQPFQQQQQPKQQQQYQQRQPLQQHKPHQHQQLKQFQQQQRQQQQRQQQQHQQQHQQQLLEKQFQDQLMQQWYQQQPQQQAPRVSQQHGLSESVLTPKSRP